MTLNQHIKKYRKAGKSADWLASFEKAWNRTKAYYSSKRAR